MSSLWISDGSTEGTIKIANVNANKPVVIDHIYYFLTDAWKQELWTSDGTTCGTFKVFIDEIPYGSRNEITVSGEKIFISASTALVGQELFLVDVGSVENPCPLATGKSETASSERKATEESKTNSEILITQYPNPFAGNCTLNVKGSDTDSSYEASIIQVNGMCVEKHVDLKRNTEYSIGSGLSSGLYVLRIKVDGKIISKRILKRN
jgi:hypothetical protein